MAHEKGRDFNNKGKEHTILNYPKKAKVFAISDTLDIDDIKNID